MLLFVSIIPLKKDPILENTIKTHVVICFKPLFKKYSILENIIHFQMI